AGEHEVISGRQFGLPAWLDHNGLVRLDDNGGSFYAGSRLELVARVKVGFVPIAAGKEFRFACRVWAPAAPTPGGLFGEFGTAADGLDRDGLDDDLLCAIDEAEPRLVSLLERALHSGAAAGGHHERSIGAGVANMCAHKDLDFAGRDALAFDLFLG